MFMGGEMIEQYLLMKSVYHSIYGEIDLHAKHEKGEVKRVARLAAIRLRNYASPLFCLKRITKVSLYICFHSMFHLNVV